MSEEHQGEERRSIYTPSERAPSRMSWTFLGLGALIFLSMFALLGWISREFGMQEIQLAVASAGIWGPLLYVGVKALTFTFAPLTAGPIQLAAGVLFGIELGVFYSVLGEAIGGTFNVLIGRLYGRPLVMRFVGQEGIERIDRFYHRYLDDWRQLLAARLALFSVYDFISYAVGFGRIRLYVYIMVTFFGGFPSAYITVRFGAAAAADLRLQLASLAFVAVCLAIYAAFRGPIDRFLERFF